MNRTRSSRKRRRRAAEAPIRANMNLCKICTRENCSDRSTAIVVCSEIVTGVKVISYMCWQCTNNECKGRFKGMRGCLNYQPPTPLKEAVREHLKELAVSTLRHPV